MSWSPPITGQRPARKRKILFSRKKGRNAYRRRPTPNRERRQFWGKLLLFKLSLLGLAAICLGLVLLYYHFLTSPYFCIKDNKDIELTGNRRLNAALILQMAGLGPGTNLLALRPGRVEQTLAAHPWIAKAEVTRVWPNRLKLSIQEREPVALVQLGELYYIDRNGSLFKPLTPGDPPDFPVITGFEKEQFAEGQGLPPVVFEKVLALLDLLKQAPPPLQLSNISEVHVDQERGFTLYANGINSAIHLGLEDFPEKLKKFASVWPFLKQRGYQTRVSCINLDYPQRVLLSLKDQGGE